MNLTEFAKEIGVSRYTLFKYIQADWFPKEIHKQKNGFYLFTSKDIEFGKKIVELKQNKRRGKGRKNV